MRVIHLSGIERSGTNYIQWLIINNFKDVIVVVKDKHYPPKGIMSEIEWNNPDFKFTDHQKKRINQYSNEISVIKQRGLPPFCFASEGIKPPRLNIVSHAIEKHVKNAILNKNINFLVNVKNPYGWHLSYSNRWKKVPFGSATNHWNNLYSKWVGFNNNFLDITLIIKREDTLRNFEKILQKIEQKFDLKRKNKNFVNINNILGPIGKASKKNFDKRKFYMDELYIDDLLKNKPHEIKKMSQLLDKDLMDMFSYRIL